MARPKNSLNNTPSSVRMGELATTGLAQVSGFIYEESIDDLRWPNSINTFQKMEKDATIASANYAIKAMIRRINWKMELEGNVEPNELQKTQLEFFEQCMHDMEGSWSDFVNETLSSLIFGYSVHEKVYKTRNGRKSGSKNSRYNDGRIGWAKLPIRSQNSIYKWNFSDDGRDLLNVEQNLSLVVGGNSLTATNIANTITIPRNKFLLFRQDTQRENPEGSSPLKSCYVPWKYKTTIEEIEAIGISRDMVGMPIIKLPPDYMSPDASEDKQAVYEWAKDTIRSIHNNEQAGLVFPKFVDPDTKTDIFEFSLVASEGSKQFDTDTVLKRYENQILMTYLADVLKLGQDASGSFALSDNKTNLLAIGIESILTQFIEVINNDLIPQTMILNGWSMDDAIPQLAFDDLEDRDLEVLGGFIQKTISTGAMEADENLSDFLREEAGIPRVDRSKPIKEELIGGGQSKSGEGMKTAGEGTAKSPSGTATSTANASKNTS